MIFNSLSYFLFLPVVYLVFYFSPERWRWLVLLVASYGFYAFLKVPYLLAVLLLVTLVTYACALSIAGEKEESARKRRLWLGSFTCVVVLAITKYFPLLALQADSILGLGGAISSAVVNIGVSYFTFQGISYLADVYLEIEEPQRHFGRFALYMAFFPKLLQGPIERAGDLMPQLEKGFRFDYEQTRSGMLLFACGLFKKVVVADRMSLYAGAAFNDVHSYSGLPLLIACYAYTLQIYFDFAGYTDMARGTARIFGIDLTENFKSPFLATSIADFWRRWHISFSRWILDYIFKPLQMGWRDWGQTGTALALIVTFLVSGIWHGVTWGFVIWGLLHGIYLASSTYYRPYQKRLHKRLGIEKSRWLKWWQIFVTFHLVAVAFIFFRAATLADALYVVSHLFIGVSSYLSTLVEAVSRAETAKISELLRQLLLNQPRAEFVIAICVLAAMGVAGYCRERINILEKPLWLRWLFYYALVISISFYGTFNVYSQFVYLQF